MNRLTLSIGLAAVGLLLLVAGCVIQVRPDGGLRIDLPPMIPVTLIANGPLTPTATVTVTGTAPATVTLTGTPVMTGTVTPTATQPTTATPTLIATAPTSAATPITGTATATTTATTTTTVPTPATATVTATAPISTTGTPPVTPTKTMTATGTPASLTGTPNSGTPATSTPQSGTRIAPPTSAMPTPATPVPTATSTPTRSVTGTPGSPGTGTPPGSATGTVTVTPGTPTPATPPATPTPIPGTVFLSNHRGYVADGVYYVVGEVVNGESFPVFNAKVIASFYDANNNLVGAQESVTLLVRIDTELSSPFKLSIPDPGNIDHYELTLVWDDISIIDSQELTILSQETRTDGQLEVFGELRNDGSVTVSNVVVVVTFYDGSGAVVDVYQGTVSKPDVARDETATYTIAIPNADLEYDHFTVQAQGALMLY